MKLFICILLSVIIIEVYKCEVLLMIEVYLASVDTSIFQIKFPYLPGVPNHRFLNIGKLRHCQQETLLDLKMFQ